MGIQNASWERDLSRLQKKLRKCAGQRSVTEELIRERRNEAKPSNHSKAISLSIRIKDPTGIAGSWSDSRSTEEIVASIHDSRKSKR